jgi:hypothetical protein
MQEDAIFKPGLHQEFVGGEIGSIGQFATAKFLNCRCRIRVIHDQTGRLCLPVDVRFSPKAT